MALEICAVNWMPPGSSESHRVRASCAEGRSSERASSVASSRGAAVLVLACRREAQVHRHKQ
eukprot:12059429-Alexandrium_andersonii.AAC.1